MGRIKFTIDAPIGRPTKSAVSMLADGRNWDYVASSNMVGVPSAACSILTPLQATAAWQNSASGVYARLGKAAWTFPVAANWYEFNRRFTGDIYLDGYCDGPIVSGTSYAMNQPWFVSLYLYSSGNDARCVFVLAYNGITANNYATVFNDAAVCIYSDGSVRIYKGSQVIGQGSLLPETSKSDKKSMDSYGYGQGAVTGQYIDLMILPLNRRICVISSLGGETVGALDGLDDADPAPQLTGAGPVTIYCPANADSTYQRMTFQACPIKFPSSGTLYSDYKFVAADLVAAPTFLRAISGRIRSGDASTCTASMDGSGTTRRIKLTVAGDGSVTPTIIGAHALWCFTAAIPSGTGTELDVASLDCQIGNAGDTTATSLLIDCGDVYDQELYETSNRGFKIDIDSVTIMQGLLNAPEVTYDATFNDLTVTGKDIWRVLEQVRVIDDIPLDGLSPEAAIIMLAACAGIANDGVTASATGFTIPVGLQSGKGEWSFLVEAGQTVAEVIHKVKQDYCDNWILTCRLELKFDSSLGYNICLLDPESASRFTAGQNLNLYTCLEALAVYPLMPWPVKLRGLKAVLRPPLANEIWVTGYDAVQRKRLQAYWINENSQDPEGTKDSSWLGMQVVMGAADTSWCDQTTVNWVCGKLAAAYGVPRVAVELRCDLLMDKLGLWTVPISIGDVVRVRHTDYYFDVRVESVDINCQLEADDSQWRDCVYKGYIKQIVPIVDPGLE